MRCEDEQTNTAQDVADGPRDRQLGKRADAANEKQEWEKP